jgi:hypothetical protein
LVQPSRAKETAVAWLMPGYARDESVLVYRRCIPCHPPEAAPVISATPG